jgi:rhodanese-related sulfurtransferase
MAEIDRLLAEARSAIERMEPRAAAEAMRQGALLVDTRPLEQRRSDGEVPGAIIVDRNVLEWRLDPTCAHRLAQVTDADQLVILMCNEGYSSSLAAATLRGLGVRHATDVVGGFQAWVASGLPVQPRR